MVTLIYHTNTLYHGIEGPVILELTARGSFGHCTLKYDGKCVSA